MAKDSFQVWVYGRQKGMRKKPEWGAAPVDEARSRKRTGLTHSLGQVDGGVWGSGMKSDR